MKAWKKHAQYLLTGEWHVHTSYTDGQSSVSDYCKKATELNIPLLAFTEHVRRDLNYSFNNFLNDIDEARENFDLIILSGCEAKVLPGGMLDVDELILKEVDYPIFAFHSFPVDIDLYIEGLRAILGNKYVCAWAHPGAFLARHDLSLPEEKLVEMFDLMSKHDLLLESNRKYGVPNPRWMDLARKYDVRIVRGSDVHFVEDLTATATF